MFEVTYRILLTINATSLVFFVFCVRNGIYPKFSLLSNYMNQCFFMVVFYLFVLILIGMFAAFLLWLKKKLVSEELHEFTVKRIECADNAYMPTYLGYFFVSTGIYDWVTFFFVYAIICAFSYRSRSILFNPLFLLFKYKFYVIETEKGSIVSFLSSRDYKKPSDVMPQKAYRINDYTFIERR